MSATVIILPVIPRIDASGADEVTLRIRLPRRVYSRMVKATASWNLDPSSVASAVLTNAINDLAGVGRGR